VYKEGFTTHSETEVLEAVLAFERSVQYLKWQIPIGLMILAVVFGALGRVLMSRRTPGNQRFWQPAISLDSETPAEALSRQPPSAFRL
jgi:hypothetical protein